MKIVRYFFYILLGLVLLFFAALNVQAITVNYYWGSHTWPLAVLMLFVFCLGCLCGLLLSLGYIVKLRKERRALRRQEKQYNR